MHSCEHAVSTEHYVSIIKQLLSIFNHILHTLGRNWLSK